MKKKVEIYQIDSGVDIPADATVPLDKLEVNDSVLFPLKRRASVQTMVWMLKRDSGKEFTIKKMDEEHARVWRIK